MEEPSGRPFVPPRIFSPHYKRCRGPCQCRPRDLPFRSIRSVHSPGWHGFIPELWWL